jgi:predicted AAA+ superfamily ATPase
VRAATDKKTPKVFVTGSSAKLLSSEFATSLGGRGLGFLVLPFSWPEFRQARPKARLEDFLQTGGYPAVVLEKNGEKRLRLLEEYFETAILKDIASRYDVRDVPALRALAVWVLTNSSKPLSYNSLRALTGLSFDAIRLYLSYLEDAFLAFQVPAFSYSLKKAMEKPRKYYAYDTGLAAAVSKSFSPDLGRKAENAVAVELVRRRFEPQYYKNGADVDFVVREGTASLGIAVCWEKDAPKREQEGLETFSKEVKNSKVQALFGPEQIGRWLDK